MGMSLGMSIMSIEMHSLSNNPMGNTVQIICNE